jgi:hypothetical protein
MARLFMVSVTHDGMTHWASIINYPSSPSTFEVSVFKELGPADILKIVLEKKDGKLQLAKDSGVVSEGFVKAIVKAFENHTVEKSISL